MSTGSTVMDNEPNTPAPGGPPSADFQLIVEAVAGNVLGNSAATYTLELVCVDETLAAPNVGMSVAAVNQAFNNANGWAAGGTAGNFTKTQTFPIAVPAGVARHVFHYIGTLVDQTGNVVSFIRGEPFIVV
ncbi:hypothetical protein [Streptomyces sp. NPDC005408]|uniref:hypothetical protein n=1 Tax=Streptomyces sp. NPDC005408 TaxID=3155341 RepID=UPI0033A69BDF